MFLEKLEITGFKSFAQKAFFSFPRGDISSKGITAVVGPNGSGKSNVADAIRWVLGEQSMKLLRSKKSEDVIFFGSDKKAQLGFCEVSLFFNNEDHAFPVDYAEVVITRRLYRTGESEYYLNKNKVRLTDVSLMCAQASIGQRSYSVIGQGMIDSIINTAPADRKDFFDEASGVKQYQIKKDSALSKLKSTRENLLQASTVVAELEPKLKFFQRQLKRLEEREELEKNLQALLLQYYAVVWNEVEVRMTSLAERQTSSQKELAERSGEYALIQKEFESCEAALRSGKTSEYQDAQAALAPLQVEKNRLQSQIALLEGRLQLEYEKGGEVQLAILQSKITDVRERRSALEGERTTLEAELAQRRAESVRLTRLLEEATTELKKKEQQSFEHVRPHTTVTMESVLGELRSIVTDVFEVKDEADVFETLKKRISAGIQRVRGLMKKIEDVLHPSEIQEEKDLSNLITDLRGERDDLRIQQSRANSESMMCERSLSSCVATLSRSAADEMRFEKEMKELSAVDAKDVRAALTTQRDDAMKRLAVLHTDVTEKSKIVQELYVKEKAASASLLELQRRLSAKQKEIDSARSSLSTIDMDRARTEAHQEDLLKKIIEEFRLHPEKEAALLAGTESPRSLLGFSSESAMINRNETRETIERLKRKLEQIGTIDEEIISEYEATKERYEFLVNQIADLDTAIKSLKEAIVDLEHLIKEKFDTSLAGINKKFDEYFKKLFNGGSAKLIVQKREGIKSDEETEGVEEDEDESVAGIEIEATPPGKKLKNIAVLSGGEKALTAVALICAILANNPSPFVVLDEVDAALDESNASRLAEILQDLAVRTQFIVITHNRVTMHIADILYGITMGDDGMSRVLSLDITTVGASIGRT